MDTEPAVPDGTLAALVEQANAHVQGSDGSDGIPLILSVNGLTVAGELIAGDQWAREHDAFHAGMTQGGIFKHLLDFYEARRVRRDEVDRMADRLTDEQQRALLMSDVVEFLHLRKAKIYLTGTGGTPENGALLWRGRLASVDGWALGELTTQAA